MKYAASTYSLNKEEEMKLRKRMNTFRITTQTSKAIHLTMTTTYGLSPNIYTGIIQNEVTMDDYVCIVCDSARISCESAHFQATLKSTNKHVIKTLKVWHDFCSINNKKESELSLFLKT